MYNNIYFQYYRLPERYTDVFLSKSTKPRRESPKPELSLQGARIKEADVDKSEDNVFYVVKRANGPPRPKCAVKIQAGASESKKKEERVNTEVESFKREDIVLHDGKTTMTKLPRVLQDETEEKEVICMKKMDYEERKGTAGSGIAVGDIRDPLLVAIESGRVERSDDAIGWRCKLLLFILAIATAIVLFEIISH